MNASGFDIIAPGLEEDHSFSPPSAYRSGLARIVTAPGDGLYTITERRWDADQEKWCDAFAPMGHVDAEARDFQDRPSGETGQLVRFWQQRDIGGEMKVFIDVGELVKVSSNDSSPGNLVDKLEGDDGTGDNIKVTLTEQDDGNDEKLKIVIAKDDIPSGDSGGGYSGSVYHRIKIPDGSSSGTRTISSDDWRGKLLACRLQVVADDSPGDSQWGGGAISGVTRYFGSSYSGPDISLVYATGGKPAVVLSGGSGSLYWSWNDNNTGVDIHGICLIQAGSSKTLPDYTA